MRLHSTIILAFPMLLGGAVQFVISQFYQKFATDALLLDSAIIGGIFFVSRATDAVLDPICGYLSDRFKARRIFILLGILALAGGMILAFLPSTLPFVAGHFSDGNHRTMHYALAAGGIFIVYLGVTLVYIPHYAWLSELYRREPQLPFFASRAVVENVGTILGGLSLGLLIPYQKTGGPTLVWLVAGMVIALAILSSAPLIAYRNEGTGSTAVSHSFSQSIRVIGKDGKFRLVVLMSFCNQFAATTLLAVSLYYTDYVLGNKELGVTVAVVFLLSATLFVPLWSYFSRRTSRFILWRWALAAIILAFPTLLIAQTGYSQYVIVFAVLVGGAAGAVILFVPQEVSRLTASAPQNEGLYFAAFTFVNKSAMAAAPLVIGLSLSLARYKPDERTTLASGTISALFIGLPAVAFLVSLLLLRRYVPMVDAANENPRHN